MLRLLFILFGAVLGLFGILLGVIGVVSYLSSFDSYDSAYLGPIAPYIASDQKDLFIKQSQRNMKTRPLSIANNRSNLKRTKIGGSNKKENKNEN